MGSLPSLGFRGYFARPVAQKILALALVFKL